MRASLHYGGKNAASGRDDGVWRLVGMTALCVGANDPTSQKRDVGHPDAKNKKTPIGYEWDN
jgi:hypothetical protein